MIHKLCNNNICIGLGAGEYLQEGEYNIFLGEGAGMDIKNGSHKFILKQGDFKIEKDGITKEQWESFNSIIKGAILTQHNQFYGL